MSKPHEETWLWKWSEEGVSRVQVLRTDDLKTSEDFVCVMTTASVGKYARPLGSTVEEERARFITSARDMVQALLDARRALLGDLDAGKAMETIDAALTKAGVPLP